MLIRRRYMENNFDENKPESTDTGSSERISPFAEQSFSGTETPDFGTQPEAPAPNGAAENPVRRNEPYYAPQMNTAAGQNGMYIPPNGAYGEGAPAKRKLGNGFLWAMIIVITILFGIIIMLSALIASRTNTNVSDENKVPEKYENLYTQQAQHVEIKLPTSPRPVLENELYADKDTGLLTTVGVAEVFLPSQVKIEIFGEMPYTAVSSGSGVIISTDGYILTNAHVVDGATSIVVKLYDGTSEKAAFVGMDRKSDLAVVKIDRSDLTAAEIGSSSSLVIGEEIAIAGAGGGFENTITYGHVTGLDRTIDTDYISSSEIHCIQTDAALNPGNSGGALVNMYGQVVGIAVALMNHETYENIGFGIAIDDAVPIAEEIIANGYVSSRTRVGISYISIGDASASDYGIESGLCVMEIDPSCDIAYSGIELYDIVTHINGVRVFGAEEVAEALKNNVPGDKAVLTVFRKEVTGETKTFEVSAELAPDTSSISGYSETISEEEFTGRDIID